MGWIRIDKDDGSVGPVTEKQVMDRARANYKDPEAAIATAKAGADIESPFAIYRWTPQLAAPEAPP